MLLENPARPSTGALRWLGATARSLAIGVALLAGPTAVLWSPTEAAAADNDRWIDIQLGKSRVIETPKNATAVAITDPTVADIATLASANKLQIIGKKVGSTDLVIQQGQGVPPIIYEITVSRDLTELVRRLDGIVEGDPPSVYPMQERIVVQGPVDDLDTLERVAQVARIYDKDFVNLMTVRGDHQVQLEVVFAEVSRSASRELGFNFLYGNDEQAGALTSPGGTRSNIVQGDARPINAGVLGSPAAGAFNLMGFSQAFNLSAIMTVLEDHAMSKILAQPTLVCLSGQQADFLAGGEVPVPGPGGNGAVTIVYKEYGIKLTFVPTVLAGNVVDMRVIVEVSEIDFGNSTRLTGIEIPAFISRKGRSHLRVDSGMTFAMAGLLSENTVFSRAEVPILGRIPVIGSLFRYVSHSRDERELVIFVTPRLVRPLGPGEVPAAPGTTESNNPSDLELFLLGMDHESNSRTAQPTGAVGLQR